MSAGSVCARGERNDDCDMFANDEMMCCVHLYRKATLWRTKTSARTSSAWIYNSLQEFMQGHPERMLDHIPMYVPSKAVKAFAQGMMDAQNVLRRTHEHQFNDWDEVYVWAKDICQRSPPSSISKATETLKELSTGQIT